LPSKFGLVETELALSAIFRNLAGRAVAALEHSLHFHRGALLAFPVALGDFRQRRKMAFHVVCFAAVVTAQQVATLQIASKFPEKAVGKY